MPATGKTALPPLPMRPMHVEGAGFTLLELLVTLAIMALVAGIAFPALQNRIARHAQTEARGSVALAFALARSDAIANSVTTRLSLTQAGEIVESTSNREPVSLPKGVHLDWPESDVIFYSDGTSNGGNGSILGPTFSSAFTVDPASAKLVFTS